MSDTNTTPGTLAAASAGSGEGAAAKATSAAVGALGGGAALVLAFSSDIDPDAAAAEATEAAAGAPVAGMTGSGVIGADGAIQCGCSVLAFAEGTPVGVGVAEDAGRDLQRSALRASSDALAAMGDGPATLLLMVDTRSGDQAEAVAGAYAAAGALRPLVGGGAGGDEPAQIAGGRARRDAVVAVAIGGDRPAGIGLAHGCRTRSVPAIATRTDGRFLFELDGRPAAEVYLERLGYDGLELGREDFAALAVTHPLGQPELNGHSRLRHVLGRGPEGALECATHIPANAAIEFTHQSPEDIVAASSRSVRSAVERLPAPRPRAALIFDCAGRKRAVAGALDRQVRGLTDAFPGPTPAMAGVFSHGEIFRLRGAKGDRNHAVVVAAFS